MFFSVLFSCLANPKDQSPIVLNPYGDDDNLEENESNNNGSTEVEEPSQNEDRVDNNPENNEREDENQPTERLEQQNNNGLGVWLWYIEGTGYSHQSLAEKLEEMGVDIIYVKVADGSANCTNWPELCDSSIPQIYADHGIEAWAWSYNYPQNELAQAEALTQAFETGYHGYVMDIESEFNGDEENLEAIMQAFFVAKGNIAPPSWELRVTSWGNPADHGMRVDIIDQYVDAHMPQTYLEVWGNTYMNDADYWVRYGTCEYRSLGVQKPVYHIVSTEYDEISPQILNEAINSSGQFTSLWRVPGEGTPVSIWNTWEQLNWDGNYQSNSVDEDCSFFP